MPDERTDEIAQAAARLLHTGQVMDIREAIRVAADAPHLRDAPLPGQGLVRRHVQGMSMQAMGETAYRESVRDVWRVAEQIMTVLEEALPTAAALFVGRAAKGLVDGPVTLQLRLYSPAPMRQVVETLAQFGYEEPSFETAETRFGRLDRIRFAEANCEVVITRCPPVLYDRRQSDLFTGRPIESVDLHELRRRLGQDECAS